VPRVRDPPRCRAGCDTPDYAGCEPATDHDARSNSCANRRSISRTGHKPGTRAQGDNQPGTYTEPVAYAESVAYAYADPVA
jgi:hypothetical protein